MTWIKRSNPRERALREYDREMLRAAFTSLFWVVFVYRKAKEGLALKTLAEKIGVNKSEPSKWFRGSRPNWTINMIADIGSALGVDIELRARDRESGVVFAPHGMIQTKVRIGEQNRDQQPETGPQPKPPKQPLVARSGGTDKFVPMGL
jgi:transcriptional regulator with XRE-family HTH domain